MAARKSKPDAKAEESLEEGPVAGPGGKPESSGAAAVPKAAGAPGQLQVYEAGIRLFREGRFLQARELFLRAAEGADRGVAHRAALHARMCERRMEQPAVHPGTAEEHYNYGVALLNARELAAAREHLQAALAMEPGADHIHYALALCAGLTGDLQSAYENLKRAIELQPRNRILARQDGDFATIANQPPLDRLLYPEKGSSL